MADDLKIKVTIQGDDNLSGPAKAASKSLDNLNKSAEHTAQSSGKAGYAVNVLAHGLAGPVVAGVTAVVGALAYATTTAADFEKTISAVGAVTGASVDELGQLRDLALDLGASTAFSAKEAAEGIGELAKGGVAVADIMGGAASAALNLAAAGGVSVADAASLAANAMSLFNLQGKDMAMVADNIAGFANATTGSVNDFKFALSAVGATAKLSGQEFDQTATALALMGAAGKLGSDAGTSLKTMLLNLVPSTKAAQATMAELGLTTNEVGNNFLNADGSFKDLRDIAGELSLALDGLSEAQQTMALKTIFGSDAIAAASILAEAGAEGFDQMAASMAKVSAEAVAAQRLDNLAGSMDSLNGTVETAAILLGSELSPALREVADGMNQFLQSEVIPFIKEHGPGLGRQLSETVKFLGQVADAMRPIGSVVGPLLLTFFSNWGEALDTTIAIIYDTIVAVVNLKNAIGEFFDALGTQARAKLEALQGLIASLGPTLQAAAQSLGDNITQGIVAGLNPGAVIAKLQGLAAQAVAAAKAKIEAGSPSELFAREVGLPMALGIGLGVERGTPEVLDALETVLLGGLRGAASSIQQWSQGAEAEEASEALWTGLLSYDPRARLEASVKQLAPAIRGALDQSLYGPGGATGGSPGRIQTPHQALIGFQQGVQDLITAADLKHRFGDLGATAWTSFLEGMKTGTLEAGNQAGQALQRVIDAAHAAGVPAWQQLGTDLMEAFTTSLAEGTEISRAKVAELLALAQQAVTAAQQIKGGAPPPNQSYGAGTGGGGTGGTGAGSAHLIQTPVQLPTLGIKAMAAGGLITRPTFALLGERGPEYVVPAGGRGGAAPVVIENYVLLDGQVIARSTRTVERQRALAGPTHGIGGL